MTYPNGQPTNGQPYYQGYGQQVPPQEPYPQQAYYPPQQQGYQQQPQPAQRQPTPYGWGIWVTLIGVLMLFAGLAAPALASTPDCTSQERRVSTLTADLEAAQASRNAIPTTSRTQRAAADRRVTEVSKQRNTAILDRDRCKGSANTGAASGVASLVVLFAPLTIGIGMTRILAGGDLMTRLGAAVHRRVAQARASRPARTSEFAPVQPQPQQVYEPQPQPFVQDFPMDYAEPAAATATEPEPTPEPERPREGWSNRRNLNFGGDD